MRCYLIRETLTPCAETELRAADAPYVAVLTPEEWREKSAAFDMGIDMEIDTGAALETKAVVNWDSLTGAFSIPDRRNISGPRHTLTFALDEKGMALIDGSGYAAGIVEEICRTKKWRLPSLERFLYDCLETVIDGDLRLLEEIENRMNRTEEEILQGKIQAYPAALNDIRGDLLDLRVHYEQLIDLGQELEENENGFFKEENLRYFRLFSERVMRLQDTVSGLREYAAQLRDLVQSQLDVRQNRIMTVLTVITTIFLPLTLIVGWYGMNFKYMPELEWRYSYPAVIVLSIVIVIICLLWFKKKKWL